MNMRHIYITAMLCSLAAAGCRHHHTVAPAVTPPATKSQAALPETHVQPTTSEFKPPVVQVDDLGDPQHATAVAEAKGWLRDAFFDFDSALLRLDSRENLKASASFLDQHRKFHVLVEGHCDERGTEQYNFALGDRRAWEAKSYLTILGVDPGHIATISYGKDRPFDPGHNEQAWAKNRRAHLVLTSTR